MKMSELITEKSPIDKANQARKLAGAAGDLASASGEWITNQLRKADPRQLYNKDRNVTYSTADKKPGGVLDKYADELAAAEKARAKNATQQARIDKADARIEKLDKIRDKLELRRNVDPNKLAKLDKVNAKLDNIKQAAIDKKVDVPTPVKPDYTSQSVWKYSAPVGGVELVGRAATSSEAEPAGISPTGWLAKDVIGGGIRKIAGVPVDVTQGVLTDPEAGKEKPPEVDTDTSWAHQKADAKESASELLKLAGLKPITERDNIAGIIRPKEIMALHESAQLDECGIMSSAPNQTASLSINATAGNGQEVANMLAAIMNLAGVKPVSSDMLGTSAMPPMPIVKAIDIISRGDLDSMNGSHHDHDDKETLTGSMEEEYGNTPENPTDVPDLDTNAHAHQPNAVDVGDRMDGTMPKGFPQVTQESLLQAYNQFKNGQ